MTRKKYIRNKGTLRQKSNNSVSSKILKDNKDLLSEPLCDQINLVFVSGTFLQQIKTAKIISVYKKGDHLDCTNYHTISLLLSLEKQIVKLIHSIMNIYLENHKCFYKNSSVSEKKHLTDYVLITITKKIWNASDNNQYTCEVFFNFQKVFDTVNQRILFSKLEYYVIMGIHMTLSNLTSPIENLTNTHSSVHKAHFLDHSYSWYV